MLAAARMVQVHGMLALMDVGTCFDAGMHSAEISTAGRGVQHGFGCGTSRHVSFRSALLHSFTAFPGNESEKRSAGRMTCRLKWVSGALSPDPSLCIVQSLAWMCKKEERSLSHDLCVGIIPQNVIFILQ